MINVSMKLIMTEEYNEDRVSRYQQSVWPSVVATTGRSSCNVAFCLYSPVAWIGFEAYIATFSVLHV
jgi:hypothetical protein